MGWDVRRIIVRNLLSALQVNVAVILALDPRFIIAAIEKDMGDSMCREVSNELSVFQSIVVVAYLWSLRARDFVVYQA